MKNTSLKYSFPTINKSSSQINNLNNLSLTQSNSSLKRNQNKNDILNENETGEELSIIENLWDDLGVSLNYQEEFKKFIKSVNNEQEKNEYLFSEKNKLRKFRESLLKLSVEISNRENNIFKLKKYISYLEKCTKEKKEIEVNFFDKISSLIKFLRINAVNIIIQIEKIREKCSYYELKGKYILNNANKSYLYDENYLINMPKNIKFINKSILFNYIETDNHARSTDLFFSNCKNIITDDNKKLKIPISIELKNAINKCKYIILQDNLFNNIKNDNMMMTSNRNMFSQKRIGGMKNSYNNRVFVPSSSSKIKKISKSNSELSLLNGSDSRKFMTMFGHNKVNLSRTLYYLKRTMGNDYENLFLSSNKNKKVDMKKSGEIMDKYFHLHKEINEDENNINSNNINNNNIILENRIDEENNFTNKSNNNKKIIIEKTYLNDKRENNINNRSIRSNKSNKSNEMNDNKKEKHKSKKVVKKSKSKSKSKSKKKETNDDDINKNKNKSKNKDLNNIYNNNNNINKNENENEDEIKNEREDDKYINYDSEKNNNEIKNEEVNDLNNNNDDKNNNDNDISHNDNNKVSNNENEDDKLIEKERINEENKESENDNSDNIKKENNISEINEDENDIENKKEEDDKNEMRESEYVYNEEEKNINNKMENRTNKSNHSIESKGLLRYKKYTEEEIKKLNDEDDEEEEDEK